jgi:hypothetical protein
MVLTMPPSARSAAPLVAEASFDATKTTMLAISSTLTKRHGPRPSPQISATERAAIGKNTGPASIKKRRPDERRQ